MKNHAIGLKQLLAVFISLLCCIASFTATASADDRNYLWQSREQFVAIEHQEKAATKPNSHPADISKASLTALLSSVDVRTEDNGKAEALFTTESLDALTEYLHPALGKATSGEDVTFVIIGLYKSLYGLAKRPRVTTGRIFNQEGKLNLILGLVLKDVNDREDRRLNPYIPGSREKPLAGDWKILPHDGTITFNLKRKDWIVFNSAPAVTTTQPSSVSAPEKPQQQPAGAINQAPALPATPVNAAPKTPAPATAPVVAAPIAPLQHKTPTEARNPAERLKTLNELKNSGLITEEEFQGKRREILNSL